MLLGKSKLLKLKEWLTIDEAARHLSNLFDEKVDKADILRLGLDGHLKLSVNFVNHSKAKPGTKILTFEEWELNFRKKICWKNLKPFNLENRNLILYLEGYDFFFSINVDQIKAKSLIIQAMAKDTFQGRGEALKNAYLNELSPEDQSHILNSFADSIIESAKRQVDQNGRILPNPSSFEEDIVSISGVWDLPMIGSERLDVEQLYQKLTEGTNVTLVCIDGACVEDQDGTIWLLMERYDEKLSMMKKALASSKDSPTKEKREKNRPFKNLSNFFPAGGLPTDSVLVVRTSALSDLCHMVAMEQSSLHSPEDLTPSERKSLIKLVFAMAVDAYGYDPDDKKSPVTKDLSDAVARADLSISDDTIRKWLKEGAKLRSDTY